MSSLAGRAAALDGERAGRGGTHPAAVAAALGLHGLALAAALFAARPAPPAPDAPVLDLSLAFPSPAETAVPGTEALPEEAEPPQPTPPPETALLPEPETVPELVPPPPEPAETQAAEPLPPEPPPEVAALPEPPPPAPPPPQAAARPRAQPPAEPRPSQPRTAPSGAHAGAPAAQVPAESGAPAPDPAAVAAGLAEYRAALLRILRANHRYPRAAEVRGDEGTVVVRFAVARDGRVLSPRVERGSGHPVLDEEAEALLRRVSPLPPLPTAVPQAQLELVVPIAFRLR